MRYAITARPRTLYACHCTACRRQSGSAFSMSMAVDRAAFSLKGAVPGAWSRAVGDRTVVGRFCRDCGTRLFHEPSRNPSIVNVKPGTLDDTTWLRPVAHLWTAHALAFVAPEPGALVFPGPPDDHEALAAAFAAAFPP
ncbi:MAG: GFA family protein [Pseudomonadota bacterium]